MFIKLYPLLSLLNVAIPLFNIIDSALISKSIEEFLSLLIFSLRSL